MPVGTHSEQHEVERDTVELPVVLVGRALCTELTLDAMDCCGWDGEAVEQRLAWPFR